MNIQLKKFNPKTIEPNRIILFVGKRNTGKSTLVRDILYHHRKIPCGMVMSPTEESNEFYKNMVPDIFVYNDYDPEAMRKMIKRQKKCVKQKKKDPNVFILLDDCMYDAKKLTKDISIRSTFMNGRHWKILLLLTMQYCMDLSPDLRANIDYVFILRENIVSNREKLYKNFFGIFPNFDTFNQVMTQCTENFECLVLDNTSRSNNISDVVFWYKAGIHPEFKIGAPKYWNFHKKHYNSNYDEDEEDLKKKKIIDKKKPQVTVIKKTHSDF